MLFSPFPRRKRLQLRISERRLVLMAGDAIAVLAAVLMALFIWSKAAERDFSLDFVLPQSHWFFILLILWLMLAAANDFYELSVAASRAIWLQRLSLITLQLIAVYLLVFFFSPRDALPRLFIIYFGFALFVFIGLWRLANPALIGWASQARRVLIIGADRSAETIIRTIREHGAKIYDIRGVIAGADDVGKVIAGAAVIGSGSDLLNYVIRDDISEIIFTAVPDPSGDIFRGVMQSYERGVALTPMPLLYERLTGRVPVEHVNTNWALVLPIAGNSIFDPYPIFQWGINTVFSLLGLVLLLVVFVPLALLIRLDSPGGIFYRQKRLGRNGREFEMIKFRTMIADAEKHTGPVFSKEGDERVTRIGRLMRRTRLDELPQIINVLKGDMSIVGPRPERPEHVVRLTEKIPFYRTRLVIRPGLTGWAQVRYDYGSDDIDALVKLEYDLYYIRHQSVLLDLNIIIRTIGRVLRMSGV